METPLPPAVRALAQFTTLVEVHLAVAYARAAADALTETSTLAALLVLLGDDRIPVHLVAEVTLGDLVGQAGEGPQLQQLLVALELGDDPCLEVADALRWPEERTTWFSKADLPSPLGLALRDVIEMGLDQLGESWRNAVTEARRS